MKDVEKMQKKNDEQQVRDTLFSHSIENGFIQIRKKPKRFSGNSEDPDMKKEASEKEREQIDKCRCQFVSACGWASDRKPKVYERLVEKTSFILKYIPEVQNIEAIEELLSDRATLFDADILFYMYLHDKEVYWAQKNFEFLEGKTYNEKTEELHKRNKGYAWYSYEYTVPEDDRVPEMDAMAIMDRIRQLATDTKNGVEYYGKKLDEIYWEYHGDMLQDKLTERLDGWGMPVEIEKGKVFQFYFYCLKRYCDTGWSKGPEKGSAALGYEPKYLKKTAVECEQYEKRNHELSELRRCCSDWNKVNTFGSMDKVVCRNKIVEKYDEKALWDAVCEYDLNGRAETQISREKVISVFDMVLTRKEYAAVIFLLVLIKKRSALGIGKYNIQIEQGLNFLNSLDKDEIKKTANKKQRLCRLQLLLSLCRLLHYPAKTVEKNLMYFLKYHGYGVLSAEEAELWRTILGEYHLKDAPVSLVLRYYDNCQQCIALDPFKQYGFVSLSALTEGAWFDFTESQTFRDCLQNQIRPFKSYKIRLDGQQEKTEADKEYLKEWQKEISNKEVPDFCRLRRICATMAMQQRQGGDFFDDWISDFSKREPSMAAKIKWDEFYTLLAEAIIQNKLMIQAKDGLMQAVNRIMR